MKEENEENGSFISIKSCNKSHHGWKWNINAISIRKLDYSRSKATEEGIEICINDEHSLKTASPKISKIFFLKF